MNDNNKMAETYLAFFDMCETEQEYKELLTLALDDAFSYGNSLFGNALWIYFKDDSDTDIPHFGLRLRPMYDPNANFTLREEV